MGIFHSKPPTVVPAFMLCDGHFELVDEPGSARPTLCTWCRWLRLDSGGFVIRKSEADLASTVVGDWKVVDEDLVLLESRKPGVQPLCVREGPRFQTLAVSLWLAEASSVNQEAVFSFVPEEHSEEEG